MEERVHLNVFFYDEEQGTRIASFGRKALDKILAEIQKLDERDKMLQSQRAKARAFKRNVMKHRYNCWV